MLLVCLHPRVLNPVIALGLKLMHKPAPETPLTARVIGTAIVVNLVSWLFNGLQIWVMTARLGRARSARAARGRSAPLRPRLVRRLPDRAGFGRRRGRGEVILIAELSSLLGGGASGTAAATAIALVSRGVTILGDLDRGRRGRAAWSRRGHRSPVPNWCARTGSEVLSKREF